MKEDRIVRALQILTLLSVWAFVLGMSLWIVWLGMVSRELSDAFTASVGISLVALPVYWTLAGVLTYTFLGLRRDGSD